MPALSPIPGVEAQQRDRSPELFTEPFWVDLEPPVGREGESYPLLQEEAVDLLLEEARYVFSAIIYGFRFRYVPGDRAREMAEEFDLELIAEIERGDPRLSVLSTRVEDRRLHARLQYRPADFQRSRRSAWMTTTIRRVAGEGEAPIWDGHDARIPAVERAIRQAVRNRLREMTDNKPREARGSVLLLEAPRISVRSGAYRAEVNVKVKVDELRPHSVY